MGKWRNILLGALILGVIVSVFYLWPDTGSETRKVDSDAPLVSENAGPSVNASPADGNEQAETLDSSLVKAGQNVAGEAEAAEEEPLPLADETAKELLFQDTDVLESADTKIGFSNRVIRRTLYRTSFKYPILLKKETVEVEDNGDESVLSEELMVGDHVLVQLPDGLDEAAFEQWAGEQGYAIRHRLRTAPIVLLSSPDPDVGTVEKLQSDLGQYFQEIGKDPLIQIVEPDFVNFPTATPNDSSFSTLWGLHNTGQSGGTFDADIDAAESWDITTDASNVLVGVIDTGVDGAHPDLSANMWTNPLEIAGNGIDDDNNGFVDDVNGWDFYENDNDPTDGGSHGTHCAGTIGAVGGNGTGVVGVAWQASMVGIRFLGPTGGSTSDAIESVNYATILGADLTSNSWGGGGFSTLLLQAIENGGTAGILFVAAAGNESVDNDANPHYPSSYGSDSIISVAASDRNDDIASFSNWGLTTVDLAAPGVSTYSTVPNNSYGFKSGTSMATPHVSGALALLRSVAPQLSHLDLKQQLLQTVDPVAAFSQNTVTGGRMNLHSAMLQVGGPSLQLTLFDMDDDAAGNGNGIINPGEPVDIQFRVSNQGSNAATNVTASLIRQNGSVFSGGTNVLSLGTISPGQGSSGTSSFRITAGAQTSTPHQEEVSLRLEWGSSPQASRDFPATLTVSTSSVISGTVTSTSNGAPISGATVAYSGPSTGTVMTNSSGGYQFEVIDGNYTLSAAAATYADSAPRSVTVPPDQTGIDFSLGRPELQVSPPSFSLNLLSGESTTRTLTMNNTGNSTLNWSLSMIQAASLQILPEVRTMGSDPDSPESVQSEVVLPALETQAADLTGSRIGVLASWSYATFEGDLTQRGAQVINTLAFPLGANELDDFDVLLVDDEISGASSSDINLIRTWVTNGGGLLIIGDNSGSIANMNSLLSGSGIQEAYRGSFDTITITDIAPHPTTQDVSSVYSSQSGTYLTLSGDAVSLMREPDGAIHAAAGKLGSGGIIAVGNELTSTASLTTGDTRLFANQIVDWLDSGVDWLTVSPESGSLAAGSSISVTLTIDAANLVSGSYSQNIVIASNDPISSQIEVPVDLNINGAPSLSVVPSQVVFGDTALGQTSTGMLTLSNVGTHPLNVSSLTASDAQFTIVDAPPILIDPDSEVDISVQFTPASAGSVSGSLAIGSNDPANGTIQVPLSGQGFVAPVIGGRVTELTGGAGIGNATITYSGPTSGTATAGGDGTYSFTGVAGTYSLTASAGGYSSESLVATIPPDRLDVDFALGSPQITVNPNEVTLSLPSGDSATRTVNLGNSGDVSLNWSSTFGRTTGQSIVQLPESRWQGEDPDAPENESEELLIPSTEAALSDLNGVRVGVIASSTYTTFLEDLTQRGALVDAGLSFPITSVELETVDVLLVDDSMTSSSTADVNVMRQWLSAGGGILVMGDNSGSMAQNNALLSGSGIEETYRGGFDAVTATDIATHPTTAGIASIYGSAAGAYCTVSGDAAYLARASDGRIHAAAGAIGAGRVIAVGDEIALSGNFSTGETREFVNQIVDWLSFGTNFDWIAANPASGDISAGGQTDVSLEFDATGLPAGSYTADWVIASNDATTPEVTVPITLQVSDAPNLDIEPNPQLLFSDTYTGQTDSLPLTINNTGSGDLTITSLDFSAPQFTSLTNLPLVIAPGESSEIDVVFAPDSGSLFSGTLSLSSDDPTGGTVDVGLSGAGIIAPAFSINPTFLDLVIPDGGSSTQTLEIANTGGADLTWNATIGAPSDVTPIYLVDWDGSPHVVGQTTATGGPNAPSLVSFGIPTVRQSAGDLTNRPLDLVGSGGGFNYGQIRFNMGDETEKIIVEFDLQKLDSDSLRLFFDSPSSKSFTFSDTHITFPGISVPYNSSVVNRIRIEFEIATLTASLSVNGSAPVSGAISSSNATGLSSIRFSSSDQGAQGGALIDNLIIGTESQVSGSQLNLSQADWLSVNPLSGLVEGGQTQSVQVSIDASSLSIGDHNTTIDFQSNDPQNATTSLPVMISVIGVPEIDINLHPAGTTLTDGVSGVTFPHLIGTGSTGQSFTIRNTGSAALTGLTAMIDGTDAAAFASGNLAVTALDPGESTNLLLTFDPAEFGEKVAVLHIGSNDADENPFDIALSATSVPDIPEIEVETPTGTLLTDSGSEVTFPDVIGNDISSDLILTVRNTGTGYLRDLAATIDGDGASTFTMGNFPLTTLNPGQTTTLRATFRPTEVGEQIATLRIASNDSDESPFDIPIKGTASPSQTTLQDWAGSYGLSGASSLATADGDRDAISLLQEYAFNLDPTQSNNERELIPGSGISGLPVIRLVGDRLQIEYMRRNTDANLTYRVLFGSNLSSEEQGSLASPTESETVTPIDLDWSRVIVNDSATTAGSSRRFSTIEVEYANP